MVLLKDLLEVLGVDHEEDQKTSYEIGLSFQNLQMNLMVDRSGNWGCNLLDNQD